MKTRDDLKAVILDMEYVIEDGVVDARCPWCGSIGTFTPGQGEPGVPAIKMEPHADDCLWLELKTELVPA